MTLMLAALLAGCKANPAVKQPAPATGTLSPIPSAMRAPFQMTMEVDPAEPQEGKPVALRVRLSDGQGKAIVGASVKATLVMVLMDMGKTEVPLAERSGAYEGTAKFTMTGPWIVVVTASAGGKTDNEQFEIAVRQ